MWTMILCVVVFNANETKMRCRFSHSSTIKSVLSLRTGVQEDIAILTRVLEAIERRAKFLLNGFIARRKLIPEEMEQRKIHLVGSVRVSGMNLWVNVRGIVEEQIEDKLALMIVGTDQIGVHRDMISNQGIGHHPLY